MTSDNIYIHKSIKAIQDYYGDLLFDIHRFGSIRDHLNALAAHLHRGIHAGQQFLLTEINNYHPEYLGIPFEKIDISKLDIDTCLKTIAHEYGYRGWDSVVVKAKEPYNHTFEEAVNLVINGRVDELNKLLQSQPELIHQRSQYGHHATLLHYCASNGVELWRQQVPHNLGEVIHLLRSAGADVNATMKVYGGVFSAIELLRTSAHPYEAGLADNVAVLLS